MSDLETRIAALEADAQAKATAAKTSVLTKLNNAWQWIHSELYNWTSHAKNGSYVIAALAGAYMMLKIATHF